MVGRSRPGGSAALGKSIQDQGVRSVHTPRRHRNISVKRLLLDAYQFVRAQSVVSTRFGKPFRPSRDYVEIDITYRCNLKCINCNRSCTQAPSKIEMPVADINAFLEQSIERQIVWKRIRLLGGEPTLHRRLFHIIDLLIDYQRVYNPAVKLVLGTNYFGNQVRQKLGRLPDAIHIKTTLKSSRVNLFRPFNVAPVDTVWNRFSDYACGCRIIEDCGLGLTPSGYYMCAVAGGIDRVFGYRLGRKTVPDESDAMQDQMRAFCGVCGHFGFQWPTRTARLSPTWRRAYQRLSKPERTSDFQD